MKFVILVAFFAFASATQEVDWSHVTPIKQFFNGFMENRPAYVTRERRIVNGETAEPHQFPYQTAVIMSSATAASLCGGSVISQFAVLTAAHCTITGVQTFLVIAGAYNRNLVEPNQQRRSVPASSFVPHPDYNQLRLTNDIAVIRTDQAFTFNSYVQPVVLASDDSERFVGSSVTVSGFGRFSDSHQQTSPVVLFTTKTVIENTVCARTFPLMVIGSTICAIGTPGINNSVCNGDSGGPLTIRRNNQSVQVGVVSFGSPFGCERDVPDGYARVSSFHTWIRQVAQF